MDLKNYKIKMGEILKNPMAKEILLKEFPEFMSPFMIKMSQNMPLEDVLKMAKGRVSPAKIDKVIAQLQVL
ncbi:MAG: hypothetical protein N2Z65_02400 [Clostridiales bacterium]|nr:hypothetical protein [Clostridiales bacterium]